VLHLPTCAISLCRCRATCAGELKPPKLKTNDEDKLYVQRPVGEQFRPPPSRGNTKKPKGAKK
jgi:hypothetical protein